MHDDQQPHSEADEIAPNECNVPVPPAAARSRSEANGDLEGDGVSSGEESDAAEQVAKVSNFSVHLFIRFFSAAFIVHPS